MSEEKGIAAFRPGAWLKKNLESFRPSIFWTIVRKPSWVQKGRTQRVSWPSKEEVEDWAQNVPAPREDGAHHSKSPFYFEWWYFDVSSVDKLSITVTMSLRDLIRPASAYGSVNVAIFNNSKVPQYFFKKYPVEAISAAEEICDVRVGPNRCWVENDHYKVKIKEGGLEIDLEFRGDSTSWRPGNGKFTFGDNASFFSWLVPQPRAKVIGFLHLDGKKYQISGTGYHDHNWGTVSLLDTIKEWSWGRFYLGGYSFIFADILLTRKYGGYAVMPFCFIDGHRVLLSSFLTKNQPIDGNRDFLKNPRSMKEPKGWFLTWQDEEKELYLTAEVAHILERADLLQGNILRRKVIEKVIAHPYYLRSSVSVKGKWVQEGECIRIDGMGIYEQITFGRT